MLFLLAHPFSTFTGFFLLALGLGAWFDRILVHWQIRRLKQRIEILRILR